MARAASSTTTTGRPTRVHHLGMLGLLSVLLALIATPLGARPALALGTLDQEVLPSAGSVSQNIIAPTQTFTAGLSGMLDTIALYGRQGLGATWNVAIKAVDGGGGPTGPDLATGSAPAPASNAWTQIALTPAIPVTAGTLYAIVVLPPTPFWGTGASPYAGGVGSSALGSIDLAFRTYVTVPPPPPVDNLTVIYAVGTSQTSQIDSGVTVPAGSTVWHRLTVRNGGTSDLAGLSLIASAGQLPAACPSVPTTLGAGATWSCTFSLPAAAGTTHYRADARSGTVSGWSVATITGVVPGPVGTAGSKLGLVSAPGSYTADTKVAGLGKYVTWQANLGAGAAGKVVGVYVSTKGGDGTWGAWTRVTGRTADATGTLLYSRREASSSWLSVRFSGDGVSFTKATQARWR
jgi:hypothetical protein